MIVTPRESLRHGKLMLVHSTALILIQGGNWCATALLLRACALIYHLLYAHSLNGCPVFFKNALFDSFLSSDKRREKKLFKKAGHKIATWLILPVVICLSQRLSHACLSISLFIRRDCGWLIKSVIVYLMVSFVFFYLLG